jgi:RNA recognition motif-containing protein
MSQSFVRQESQVRYLLSSRSRQQYGNEKAARNGADIEIATTLPPRNSSISSESLAQSGMISQWDMMCIRSDIIYRQIRQGIANNTKGTAFVVFEDVMDAKQACDKLNGFNFQNRYLVGQSTLKSFILTNL